MSALLSYYETIHPTLAVRNVAPREVELILMNNSLFKSTKSDRTDPGCRAFVDSVM